MRTLTANEIMGIMYFDGKRTIDDKVHMKEQTERKPTAIVLMRVSTALQEAEV